MDGVQLPQGYSHSEEAVYFLPFSSQKFVVPRNLWNIFKVNVSMSERHHWLHFSVFSVDFRDMSLLLMFLLFWYFYCLTLNEWSFAENVNYWKSLKAKRDRDMFEIKSCLRKSLVLAVWIFLSVFFLIRYTGIEVLYIRVGRPGWEPEVILVLWIYQECNAARNW